MLGITNLNEFYEDNRKNYADKLKAMAVLDKKGKILTPQMEIISTLSLTFTSLHSVFLPHPFTRCSLQHIRNYSLITGLYTTFVFMKVETSANGNSATAH